ncbi:MAG: hypothetical protein PHE30_03670 [Candidatus Omnitrophica bacterium]|nr:hypothetical protein [Candidatus Omnitrophota bacterium]MDD5027183.1 hypothetical protein [Candidatus Omnitrophota bacterium]MDD5662435.1 hypothetical protein [Candidatus Omnitrophota bacterium]
MREKGLCNTCANERGCVLPQKLPVWQCEEFNNYCTVIEEKRDKVVKPRRGLR